jgi:hypothetical protein
MIQIFLLECQLEGDFAFECSRLASKAISHNTVLSKSNQQRVAAALT